MLLADFCSLKHEEFKKCLSPLNFWKACISVCITTSILSISKKVGIQAIKSAETGDE